eukprot:998813_1
MNLENKEADDFQEVNVAGVDPIELENSGNEIVSVVIDNPPIVPAPHSVPGSPSLSEMSVRFNPNAPNGHSPRANIEEHDPAGNENVEPVVLANDENDAPAVLPNDGNVERAGVANGDNVEPVREENGGNGAEPNRRRMACSKSTIAYIFGD